MEVKFEPLIVPSDYTTLGVYFTSGASFSSKLHADKLRSGVLKDIIAARNAGPRPPWKQNIAKPADELANRVLSGKVLIDPKDPLFDRTDLSDDVKKLFALYKALERMRESAEYAQSTQGRRTSGILDRVFQRQVGEITDYLSDTRFLDMSLVAGLVQDSITSTVNLPQVEKAPRYVGGMVSTSQTAAVSGLAAGDKFTITVTQNGVDKVVNIDLADVSGTLSLDNIVDHLNSELLSAGISTEFSVEAFSSESYGLRVDVGYEETVNFSADAATEAGALYITGLRGTGDNGGAFITKIEDLGSADPTEDYYKGIDSVGAADKANGVAVDSQGNVYVVGTTAGDLGDQPIEGSNDVYLRKYDAAGTLIYTQRLGATENASGFAVAVDGNDNVIVAGQVSGTLTTDGYGGNYDTFVTKYSSDGQELFTRQAAPFANDAALAITIDSSDNIFLAGLAYGAIANDQTYGGGSDAYVTKLDSSGTLVYNKQFAEAGDEKATAITVDNAGNVYVAGENDGSLFVRKYADTSSNDPALWEHTAALGSEGAATGIALDSNNDVYFTGYTTSSTLFGTPVTAHSGGVDGFLGKLDNATGAVTFGTFFGTTADDRSYGVAIDTSTNDAYITGSTAGTLSGETSSGKVDAFAAKIDSTGNVIWNHQFGGAFDQKGLGIAFDSNGTNVLTRLGLPNGNIPQEQAYTVTTATPVRDGRYFFVSVDGEAPVKITIDRDDSFGALSFKLRAAFGTKGNALFVDSDIEGRSLKIDALDGHKIEIIAGPEGKDALTGLGLKPVVLFGEIKEGDTTSEAVSAFGLEFTNNLNILTESEAADAVTILENAQRIVRKAYRLLTEGPEEEFVDPGKASALTLRRLASYQAALDRLVVQPTLFSAGSRSALFLTA